MVAIPQSTHSWLGRFCVRLMQLCPDTQVVHAVQHAVAAFPYASSLEPEHAAEVFAQRHPAQTHPASELHRGSAGHRRTHAIQRP
jgi:hypothetical protein